MIMNERAEFDLALRLRREGATVAEVFAFLSGLYFRGKIAYARAFGCVAPGICSSVVITPTRGLIEADTRITVADLREFASVDIDKEEPLYRKPLQRDARHLAKALPADIDVVLLGSVATGKYVDILLASFGEKLRFPMDFVGRGDMSRGGLLLRSAADRQELSYIPVAGAVRNGKRPPKLTPRRYPKSCAF